MSLLSLPVELVTVITDKIHPSSIVDFACTCRTALACAKDSLRLHRERQRMLRAQHDRHPMNVVNLIRMLKQSPELGWYVRILEFYGSRSTWEAWATYHNYKRVKDEPRVDLTDHGPEIFEGLGLEDDIHQLLSHAPSEEADYERFRLYDKGNDRPLKTILVGLCPALEKVTWVAHEPSDHDEQPFTLLCNLASMHRSLEHSAWPASLLNLRSISIGTGIDNVHPHDNLHPDTRNFCELLLLPNLKCLRINVGGYGDQDLDFLKEAVPARSSSVEELTFNICHFETETLIAILERLRCLRSYINIYPGGDQHEILDRIQPWFGDTMQTLIIGQSHYNYRDFFKDVSVLSGFRNLRTLNLELNDLKTTSASKADSSTKLSRVDDSDSDGSSDEENFAWLDIDALLPPLVETINFTYSHRHRGPGFNAQRARSFLKHLDPFVQKRCKKHDDGCLKVVGLAFVTKYKSEEKGLLEEMVNDWRDAWSNAGVEVVTDFDRIEVYEHETLETAPENLDYDDDEEEEEEDSD